MADARASHAACCRRLAQALRDGGGGAPPRLQRADSNLFRHRLGGHRQRLDAGGVDQVLAVNVPAGWVDTGAGIDYEHLVDATLPHGVVPAVVPQLKSITVGGAVAGVGIEASSFRHGLVHDTLLEADVLLADGRIVTCAPEGPHRALFFGLANSYGTLGYLVRARLRTVPARPFVAVQHLRFNDPAPCFAALDAACADPHVDFVDGVAFARDDLVLTLGRFSDTAPRTSDYTFEQAYHASLRRLPADWLTTRDWLWRWDTDWFWCARHLGVDRPWVRRLLGRARLNSRTYARCMRWNARWGLTPWLARLRGMRHVEPVVQDVDLPRPEAPAFLDFLFAAIGILPIWLCPVRAALPGRAFPLFPLRPGVPYLNFGFWDVIERRDAHPPAHFNRLVERRVAAGGGIKSLYSDAFYSRAEFAACYGLAAHAALKARYDPHDRLLGLYEKCVLRQ